VIDNINIKPLISERQALDNALKYIDAKNYRWENNIEEQWLKKIRNDENATFYPKGELLIYNNDEKSYLVYSFEIATSEISKQSLIYINAHSGELVLKLPLSHTANANGNADTRYSASKAITTDSYLGSYRLRELRNNVRIETYNLRNGTNYGSAIDFVDNDNNWTSAEFNNSNKDNAGLDAHWGAEQVYEYWKQVHKRNSIDNNGLPILNYVHYSSCYDNANWDPVAKVMRYGDGCTKFSPLVSLDVVGHELGHGICQSTANLVYEKESGALNEGFSDIWGACIEQWATTNKQTWLIGEEITLYQNALRSMNNPGAFNQPDTYGGPNWFNVVGCTPDFDPYSSGYNDGCGVHKNSGVLNKWFYLLSVGGNDINGIHNSYCVSGIGINKAATIAYRAESYYLRPDHKYADARLYTIQAAIDSFGVNSNEVIQTTNAWYAVGVGAQYNYTISGPSAICTTGQFSVPNLPVGTSWSSSNTSRLTIDNNGLATRVNNFNGTVTLFASLSSCGVSNLTKIIKVGNPYINSDYPIIGPNGQTTSMYTSPNSTVIFHSNPLPGVTNYQWSKLINSSTGAEMVLSTGSNYFTYSVPSTGLLYSSPNTTYDIIFLREAAFPHLQHHLPFSRLISKVVAVFLIQYILIRLQMA